MGMNLIEKTELKDCDHDWENISIVESVERQLICTYCSEQKSEPFDVNVKQWSDEETDHCSDIRNHISPNTKVIEHESNKNTV